MPRVVVILADGFEEVEAMAIVDVLRRADIDTVTAGLHEGPVVSARKVKVIPDTVIDKVRSDDFDMIVLPGGQPGSDNSPAWTVETRPILDWSANRIQLKQKDRRMLSRLSRPSR